MDRVPHDFVNQVCRQLSSRTLRFLAQLDKTWFNSARQNVEKIVLLGGVLRQPFASTGHVYSKLLRNARKIVPDYDDRSVLYRIDDLNISPSNATSGCDIISGAVLDNLLGVCAIQCNSLGVINMDTLAPFKIYTFNVYCLKTVEINNTTLNNEPEVVLWIKKLMKAGGIETLLLDTIKVIGSSPIEEQDFTDMIINEKRSRNLRLNKNKNFPKFNIEMLGRLLDFWKSSEEALGRDFKIWSFYYIEDERTYKMFHSNGTSWVETDLEMVYFHQNRPQEE
ncbi:hypothetical protein QR680_003611 [Steinernema hermaphroditum]|uniref:F-box domain-containing protein n=1 Tax=Steinernema hermaphroditum TaxID=289476 RepID=A0AA39HKY4_9BILA|nr:hypothetical protein QR680_003611 [Steinernema hermaphroditum]